MAEALLIPAADAILSRLLPLATNQINLAWGFKEDLKKLRKRLEIIQALLYDAGNRKITSHATMVWLKDLKAATCDAENVLDELAYEALRRKIEVQNRMKNKHVRDKEEAEKAKILEKSNIQEFQLHWYRDLGDSEVLEESNNNHEDVLEGLKPHRNVKGLILTNFGGRRWASWMSTNDRLLQNLVKIELKNCRLCEQVPALGRLPHLASIVLEGLHNLKRIGPMFYGPDEEIVGSYDGSGVATARVFPALRKFKLWGMPQLEEWSDVSSLPAVATSMIECFPHLQDLLILGCPKLITIPEAAFSGSTSLQYLWIRDCPELTFLPDALLQPTLVNIWLSDCPKLQTPINPDALRSLTSLKCLAIVSCPNWGSCWMEGLFCTNSLQVSWIGDFGEDYRYSYFPWPSTSAASPPLSHLTSLQFLSLRGWPEVKSLPDQLELLPILRNLRIWDFIGLESLPEWLGNLSSLKSLDIHNCPLLEKRCEKGIGEDWDKIAHIPCIEIDGRKIQWS